MITNQCSFQAWAEATMGQVKAALEGEKEKGYPEVIYYLMAEILFPAYVQLEINESYLLDTTGQRLNSLSDLVVAIEEGRWPITTNQQETNA